MAPGGGSLSSLDWTLRIEVIQFQTIDADTVVTIAVVEDERLLAVRQDLEGSLVRRCEGWAVVIAAHKDVGAVCQSGRHERRSGAVLGRRSRCQVANWLAEGTVLPLGSLAHEVLLEPSVALPPLRIPALLMNTRDLVWVQCVCRAGPMAVRRAN